MLHSTKQLDMLAVRVMACPMIDRLLAKFTVSARSNDR
jgi:hypothetical protein